jgi:transcriptional regulator with XRE-family HTH domain
MLEQLVAAKGSQKEAAKTLRISEQYLSDVLKSRREPGSAILIALGLERHVTFRKVQPPQKVEAA